MSSPHSRFAALVAVSALMVTAAAPAFADGDSDARNAAIAACKTAVATSLSADVADVRLDRVTTRGRTIEVRLEARKDGVRTGLADCTYNRRAATTEVVVAPSPNQTAQR